MGQDHFQVGKRQCDVFQLQRQAPANSCLPGEGRALVPQDRQSQLLTLAVEGIVARVHGIEALIRRCQLQPLQAQALHAVLQLLNGIGPVGIDGSPPFKFVGMLPHIGGDNFVGDVEAGRGSLQAEHHHLVRSRRRGPMAFRPCIEQIPRGHVAVKGLGGQPHVGLPRLCGILHHLRRYMVRVPHHMGMTVDDHVTGVF